MVYDASMSVRVRRCRYQIRRDLDEGARRVSGPWQKNRSLASCLKFGPDLSRPNEVRTSMSIADESSPRLAGGIGSARNMFGPVVYHLSTVLDWR